MDLFAKFTAKDRLRIPAEFYNLVVDAVRFYMQSRPDRKSEKIAVQGPTRFGIKNISASTLEQYAVVGIGAGLAVPGGDDTYYYGDAYFNSAAPAAASPFAILQEPAVVDAFSPATCAGFSFVRISVTSTSHAYAVPSAGIYTHLVSQSAVGPATILWKETGGTLLNGAINNSVTYITVDSGDGYPDTPFVVTIDSEDLNVTAVRGSTLLNGAISDTATSIVVDSAAGFPTATPFVVVIGTERMNVTAGGGTTTWTVTRGYQNSTADQHADNDPVTALANTYWTVTRAYNATSAASHADNAPVTMKSGVVWALVRIDSQGIGSGTTPTVITSPATGTATGPAFTFQSDETVNDITVSGSTVKFPRPNAWVMLDDSKTTTTTTSIAAGAGVVVTLASATGIIVGSKLSFGVQTYIGADLDIEIVTVDAVSGSDITADFTNDHASGTDVVRLSASSLYPGLLAYYDETATLNATATEVLIAAVEPAAIMQPWKLSPGDIGQFGTHVGVHDGKPTYFVSPPAIGFDVSGAVSYDPLMVIVLGDGLISPSGGSANRITVEVDFTLVQAYSAALDAVTGTNTGDQDATTTPYTPAVSADWTGADPTTVAEALDRIAAALGPIA